MHPWKRMDPYVVLSICNMKLRNYFSSLEALCEDENIDPKTVEAMLQAIGYTYNPQHNQFIASL